MLTSAGDGHSSLFDAGMLGLGGVPATPCSCCGLGVALTSLNILLLHRPSAPWPTCLPTVQPFYGKTAARWPAWALQASCPAPHAANCFCCCSCCQQRQLQCETSGTAHICESAWHVPPPPPAAAGGFTWLTYATGQPCWDSIGSIAVGLLMGVIALQLMRTNKRFLIGGWVHGWLAG